MATASRVVVPLHDNLFLSIDGEQLVRPFTQQDGQDIKRILKGLSIGKIRSYLKRLGYDSAVTVGVVEKSSNS